MYSILYTKCCLWLYGKCMFYKMKICVDTCMAYLVQFTAHYFDDLEEKQPAEKKQLCLYLNHDNWEVDC